MTQSMLVRLPAGFDFAWTIRFLAVRAVPSLEAASASAFRRVVRLDDAGIEGASGVVTLAIALAATGDGEPALRVSSEPALAAATLERIVTRMFDLDADVPAFAAHVAADEVLGPLVASHRGGIRLPQLLDPFEAMVRAVLGQQVSVQAASTMTDRVTRLASEVAPVLADTDCAVALPLAFPAPRALLESGEASLRGIGLTGAKTKSLLGLARAVCEGTLDLRAVREMPAADAQAALVALPGIGPWTASYVRMRSLGDRDAFPAADLGVIKAMAARGVARGDIEAVAERWRPWRAYATLHLWQSLAAKN